MLCHLKLGVPIIMPHHVQIHGVIVAPTIVQ